MPEEKNHTDGLKVVLLSNYEPDAQESMERFARMLANGLKRSGHLVRIIRPAAVLANGNTNSGLSKWLGYVDKYLLFPPTIKAQVKWADIVHICDHSNAVYLHQLPHVANVVTCHDLLAVRAGLGEKTYCPTTPAGKLLQRWILHGLRHARIVACDSQATKNDVERLLRRQDGIRLVRLGLNYPFSVLAEKESAERLRQLGELKPGEPFLLHVGSSLLRKNRDGVLRIFARIKDRFQGQLVFAGAPLTTELLELARDLSVSDRIVVVNHPDDAILEALYNSALVLLFPSRAEGFGCRLLKHRLAAVL